MPAWFRRIRRFARRLADYLPLTPLGLAVVAGSAASLRWLAFGGLDMVMLVVGYAGLGLAALSVVLVLAGAALVKWRARGPKREAALSLETRRETPTGFRVPSLGWLPLVVAEWEIESPDGVRVVPRRARTGVEEDIVVQDRGEVTGLVRRLVISDVLGLARVAVRKKDPTALDVLPGAGALRSLPVLASLAGGDEQPHPMGLEDGDRIELRRYAPGDPARFIHWKVFARTRKLMVRMPERALSRARRTVAYLVAGPSDDASAAAARVAIEHDALGGEWVFGADGAHEDATNTADALRLVVRSVTARDRGGRALAQFLQRAERSGPASLVLFVPPVRGPWLDAVLAVVRAHRSTRVVIGVDAVSTRATPPAWQRLLRADPPEIGTRATELDEVIRALAATRCDVVVFERSTGTQLGELHRRAMSQSAPTPKKRDAA